MQMNEENVGETCRSMGHSKLHLGSTKSLRFVAGRLLLNYFVASAKFVLGKLTINVLKEN